VLQVSLEHLPCGGAFNRKRGPIPSLLLILAKSVMLMLQLRATFRCARCALGAHP
jgi:hypothetical protein